MFPRVQAEMLSEALHQATPLRAEALGGQLRRRPVRGAERHGRAHALPRPL